MAELLLLSSLMCAALLVGNEFTVGVFINPAFSRLPEVPQAAAARETARLYGKVMPFWMALNLILSLTLVFAVAVRYSAAWWFFLTATILFAFIIVFSIVFPVPINNRIASWDANNLPDDWRDLRRRFDRLHAFRVLLLLTALACLILGAVEH